jgi:hypothetical protein
MERMVDNDKQRKILEEYADSLVTGAKRKGNNQVAGSKSPNSVFQSSNSNLKIGRGNIFN